MSNENSQNPFERLYLKLDEVLEKLSKLSVENEDYIPVEKVLEKFNVCPKTLRKWRNLKENPLQTIRIGNIVIVRRSSLDEFFLAHEELRPL